MQIVLHAGFHKTGTTSLQATLDAHRAALSGFAHVETSQGTPDLTHATRAARAYCLNPDAQALALGMATWVACLPDLAGKSLLVSSEDFAGHIPGRFGVLDYRAAVVTVPAAVDALRARFPGARVRVALTTRAAKPWLKSVHWQVALHPELVLKQRRFCKEYAGAARFEAVVAPLAAALAGKAEVSTAAMEDLVGLRLGFAEALYDLADLPDDLREALPPIHVHKRRSVEGLADQFVMLNRAKLPPDELGRAKTTMSGIMRLLDTDNPV